MGDAMSPNRTIRSTPPRTASAAVLAIAAMLALAACDKPAPTAAVAPAAPTATATPAAAPPTPAKASTVEHAEPGIAWRQAANDGEVDAAFAAARSENKPVFVYW